MSVLRRAGVFVASSAVAVSGLSLIATPSAQAAVADPRPVTVAVDWLKGQLTNGLIHNNQFNFDDIGLTIDAGTSLNAIGGQAPTVAAIADAVSPKVVGASGYIQSDEYDYPPPTFDPVFKQIGYYANAAAKTLAFAVETGQDPATWTSVDLVDAVENRVIGTGPSTGRLQDDSFYGDFANVIGQGFAARGLVAESSPTADAVLAFLLDQQCADGYFRLSFTTEKAATDQTCDGGIATGASAPDTDVTALVLLQLGAISSPSQDVLDAIQDAKNWLIGAQRADGSFGGGASTEAANTNSTGLAGWALGDVNDQTPDQNAEQAAVKASVWVRQRQADELASCANALSNETGALGYDDAAVAAGRANGIVTQTEDQWRRTTAPVLPVLQWTPSATPALGLTGPSGFVRGGTTVAYAVSGVVPGDKVCLSALGVKRPFAAGPAGTVTVPTALPAVTADRQVSVTDRGGDIAGVVTRVLGPKTFKVTTTATVKRGALLTVKVLGLKPGEAVRVNLRGVLRRSGIAGANGVFVAKFVATRPLGRASVTALGEFPAIRRGATTVTVVR